MPSFGRKSTYIKSTIHPCLVLVCDSVVKYFDIALISGRREKEEQDDLFSRGLSQLKWPLSKHNADPMAKYPKNLSMAVDVIPWPLPEGWGDLTEQKILARDLQWKERVKLYQMVAIFKFEWQRLQGKYKQLNNYYLRFGADWNGDNDFRDQNFDDLPHIELVEII